MEEHLKEKGNWLLLITIFLITIGLLMILSVSFIKTNVLFIKQLSWVLLGLLLVYFISKKKLSWWNKYYIIFFLIFLAFLSSSLFFPPLNGARRWLVIEGITLFQPSEFVKVFFLFYLSSCFSKDNSIFPPSIILGIILAILLFQPHFGMAGFLFLLTFFFFILAGAKIRDILIFVIFVSFIIGIASYNNDYVKDRIQKYIKKDSFQVEQAKIAIGAGGIFGVGPGKGMKKSCLPASYSEFIFPIIGEEGGFFLCVVLLILFILFGYFGFSIAFSSSSKFGFFLSFFLTFSILFQAIMNIIVVLGNLPTTGLPLPFISYGGSSLISNLIAVSFIMNVARSEK